MQDDPSPSPGGSLIQRSQAFLMDLLDRPMHRIYGRRKRELLGEAPAEVVEIGPGAGANFRYYPPDTRVIAVEPNPAMHRKLRHQAKRHGLELEIRGLRAEGIDLPDASAEMVVSTLVLCSVDDPERVVEEVKRLLVPGGRFVFIEHVAAPEHSWLFGFQRLVRRPWRFLFDGCDVHRDTAALLAGAGFTRVEMDCFMTRPPLSPVSPHIVGTAVR